MFVISKDIRASKYFFFVVKFPKFREKNNTKTQNREESLSPAKSTFTVDRESLFHAKKYLVFFSRETFSPFPLNCSQ